MGFVEIPSNDVTTRYFNYNNKVLTRTRDDTTGNYLIFKQHLSNNKTKLKNIYGGNGDISNISASFLLKFPNAKYSDFKQNKTLKGQLFSTFKSFDSTGVLSIFELDTSAPNDTELSIYVAVSWEANDVDAETKANALIATVTNSTDLTNLFTTLPVSSPFDTVVLDTSLEPLTIDMYVSSTIHSLVTTYNSGAKNTDIEIKTVGLYDHIGVKINTEDDNQYRRLRTNGIKTVNIDGVDPSEDVIIATLFDKDYKKLYTIIQSPSSYMQGTQGTNGDLLNEAVDGSMTLDLDHNQFTTENRIDFITTMNTETGGHTIIIDVYEGSAIIEYRIIFDISKTQQEINDVVAKLSDDSEIQGIINKSKTMNTITANKTANKIITRTQKLTKYAKIVDIIHDETNNQIKFKTIGLYTHILYKATEEDTYIQTTDKVVNIPIGFTNKIDVKLVDVNNNDIMTILTHYFDLVSPVITLNGGTEITMIVGDNYNEQGATVTDNSGESLTPVITGTVNSNTPKGTYTITYTATDSSENSSTVYRTVKVLDNFVDLIADNFKAQAWPNKGLPTFEPTKIKMTSEHFIALYTDKTIINYNNPFRIITRMANTVIPNSPHFEIGLSSGSIGENLTHQFYLNGSNPIRTTGVDFHPYPASVFPIGTFNTANANRYIVITYKSDGNTDLEIFDEYSVLMWGTTISTNMNWGVNPYAMVFYINAGSCQIDKVYTTNNTEINITQSIGHFVNLIADNFSTSTQSGGLPSFTNDSIITSLYDAIGLKTDKTTINYNNPFRIITKLSFTTAVEQYFEVGLSSGGIGQGGAPHYIIIRPDMRTNNMSLVNTYSVNSFLESFYTLNVNRYVVITYKSDGNTDLEIFDEHSVIIWRTTITTNMHFEARRTYAMTIYVNNCSCKIYDIYTTNNTEINITQALGPQ